MRSRFRPSPAMAVAIVALVFAMIGTAAATDIFDKQGAQKAKKGKRGPRGPAGPAGAAGATGPAGPFPGAMPSGATYRGTYAMADTAVAMGEGAVDAISYGFRLAASPTANVIPSGGLPTAACPGSPSNPQATAGNLCVYEFTATNTSSPVVTVPSADPQSGVLLIVTSSAAGLYTDGGTWAVTAP